MILTQPNSPLVLKDVPTPMIKDNEILVKVSVCGVCRTDLHVKDGDLPHPKLPLILGHEIVGTVEALGANVKNFHKGERVGIPWLRASCGKCAFCKDHRENLCDHPEFTGYLRNGGFAEYAVCPADFAIALPHHISDAHIAPLLCAGLIGYRAYRMAAPEKTLGLYGFGASAHIVAQLARHEEKQTYVFTRPGHTAHQEFAKKLGATWVGDSTQEPPTLLDAVIIFAPVGDLIPAALKVLKKGGRCICSGIHMSDIPSFPYSDLWGEKRIQSVANLTREDAKEFFALLKKFPIHTHIESYPLEKANEALDALREGSFSGAAVLHIGVPLIK